MKTFIFDPLWPDLLTNENKSVLDKAGAEIILITEEAPIADHKDLFEGSEPRILAINPDYVGWSLPTEVYKNISNLKAIITASTSYGWIASEEADRNGTAIVNIRNFSTDAVADWAVMASVADHCAACLALFQPASWAAMYFFDASSKLTADACWAFKVDTEA